MLTKNKTTELLKGCGRGSYPHFCGEKIKGISNSGDLCPECKSELKGRLDAFKEEVEFIKNFQTNCLCERCGRLDSLHRKKLASIQEEIKLIEGGI